MTQPSNFQRAHWAALAIRAFRQEVGMDDDLTSIQDLIADLGHYCSLNQLDFVGTCADAISCWQAELADPLDETLEAGPEVRIDVTGHETSTRHWRQTASATKPRNRARKRGGQ